MAATATRKILTADDVRRICEEQILATALDVEVNDDDLALAIRKELGNAKPTAGMSAAEVKAAVSSQLDQWAAAQPKGETGATAADVARINTQLKNVAAALGGFTHKTVADLEGKLGALAQAVADLAALPRTETAPPVAAPVDEERTKELIRAALKSFRHKTSTVVIPAAPSAAPVEVGLTHKVFAEVLELAAARENIYLVGPAGPGKTTLARQIATAIGAERYAFLSLTAGTPETHFTGRFLPVGAGGMFCYVPSRFVECYEQGGLFLLDEIDNGDANTLAVINAAIDNGEMSLPNRPDNPVAKRHPDFVLIVAANTHGTGADRQYVGRNQLDAAFLDRFSAGMIEMDYDEDLEAALTPNYGEVRRVLQEYRRKARAAKLRRIISTRFICKCARLGWALDRVEKALFCGWSADEVSKVKGGAA